MMGMGCDLLPEIWYGKNGRIKGMVIIKGKIVTIFHPDTKNLVRATVMSYAENGQWWLKLDDGFGVRVGAAELFWKEWMFLNLKKSH